MPPARHSTSERIPSRGTASRGKPVLDVDAGGPLHGHVKVTPVHVTRYARRTVIFEVRASWTGPPLPGSGFPPAGRPVDAADVFNCVDLELAKAMGQWAVDELRAGRIGDLRAAAKRFKARDAIMGR